MITLIILGAIIFGLCMIVTTGIVFITWLSIVGGVVCLSVGAVTINKNNESSKGIALIVVGLTFLIVGIIMICVGI